MMPAHVYAAQKSFVELQTGASAGRHSVLLFSVELAKVFACLALHQKCRPTLCPASMPLRRRRPAEVLVGQWRFHRLLQRHIGRPPIEI
jgi:hypothetical protein